MASMVISPSVSRALPVATPKPNSSAFSGHSSEVAATRTVLTARGRRVLGALLVSLAVLCSYALSGLVSAAVAAGDGVAPSNSATLVVEPGDTLWSIASELDPGADPREMVHRIATMNALPADAQLQVGQTLAVPSTD